MWIEGKLFRNIPRCTNVNSASCISRGTYKQASQQGVRGVGGKTMLGIDGKPYSVGTIVTAISTLNTLLILLIIICPNQEWFNSLQLKYLFGLIQLPGIANQHLFDPPVHMRPSRESEICICLRIKAARFKLFPSRRNNGNRKLHFRSPDTPTSPTND